MNCEWCGQPPGCCVTRCPVTLVSDLEAQLAAAKAERDKATAKADAHERDWYAAKSEFGDAMTAQRERLRASESAHAETRRGLEVFEKSRRDWIAVLDARSEELAASVAREAETWRMVDALIEALNQALAYWVPRIPGHVAQSWDFAHDVRAAIEQAEARGRDALLAARAEREKKA